MTAPARTVTAALLAGVLLAGTGCTGGGPAGGAGGGAATARQPQPAPAASGPGLEPYLDATLPRPPGLEAALPGAVRRVRFGFVTAGPGCVPRWGGRPVDDPEVLALAGRLRRAGVQPVPSFGGARPGEPALVCPTPQSLADLYGSVLALLGSTAMDLDLEGRALTDPAAVRRRNRAVTLLRTRPAVSGSRLTVTWTVPADAAGPSRAALAALRTARDDGALPDRVDVMAMNLGTGSVGPEVVRQVAAGAVREVRALRPDLSAGRARAAVGLVVMIGVNDLPGEVLRPVDAARVAADARRAGLGGLSFWSLNRDRPCAGADRTGPGSSGQDRPARAAPDCSGVDQQAGDYLAGLSGFGKVDADPPGGP